MFHLFLLFPKLMSHNDFRPISLVSCMYKILAKFLANRLKKVLSDMIYKINKVLSWEGETCCIVC